MVTTVQKNLGEQLKRWRHQSTDLLNRSLDKHLKIGITGFSGSGKSTFITSLVHQLKHAQNAQLGGFLPARDNRLLSVTLSDIPGIPLFDYISAIDQLSAEPPRWPNSTKNISGTRLHIHYKQPSIFQSFLGETRQLTLDIRDYPGEWLIDIPMLSMDFITWSHDTISRCQHGIRKDLIASLSEQLLSLNPLETIDNERLESLVAQYQNFLQVAQARGLTVIQPGRMLLVDTNHVFAHFMPLFNLHQYNATQLKNAPENSLYKILNKRYQSYTKQLVEPFYRAFFSGIDRQVILIDVIKALSGGKECFDDMMIAYSRIIDSYQVGHNNLLTRLIQPRVEKILFLASKPDRILTNQHESLRQFVDALINRVCPQSVRNLIQIETEIAAAVRSSEDHQHYLTAKLIDGRYGELRHPTIPDNIPTAEQWQTFENWQPPVLQPPLNQDLKYGARLSHIRMDKVLRDLIGDKFQ